MRVERIGDATLYLGDCLEILPTLGPVDAVVTDPPYGIGKAEWDAEYPDWIESLSFRIARTVVIMPGLWALPICVANMRGRYKSILAGHNRNGMTHGPVGYNNWIPAVVGGEIPNRGQDAFDFVIDKEKEDHPSPKPLAFMLYLIDRTTETCATVLDPFMGSGTTGVACISLGRKFIGIEIKSKYFDIACRRIEREHKQGKLALA